MGLATLIASDAAALTQLGDHDEAFTVRNESTGVTYSLRGWVTRKQPEQIAGAPSPAPLTAVFIVKSSDPTIGLPSIDLGSLIITVADREGGATAERRPGSILSQSPGGWWLKLR